MLKKLLFVVMTGVFVFLPLAVQAELVHYPTEVTFYNTATAYNGITMFTPTAAPGKQIYTYMIDMDGRFVHKIKSGSSLPDSKFLETGRLLTGGRDANNHPVILEAGWSGGTLWSAPAYWGSQPAELVGKMQPWLVASNHHDINRHYNKKLKAYTYWMVVSVTRTQQLALDLGAPPNPSFTKGWSTDGVIEMNSAGQIVWMWTHADHLCQNSDPAKPNYVTDIATAPGKLFIGVENYSYNPGASPINDWTHVNSFDFNPTLGYVVMNSRNQNEFIVVDHDKTFVSTTDFTANVAAAAGPDGDFVYRFGSPTNYNQGDPPAWTTNGHTQIWGAHNIQWIKATMYTGGPALPGAGNFIIFDNHDTNANPLGGSEGSPLKEINPYVTGPAVNGVYPTGAAYVNPPLAGYIKVNNIGLANPASNQSNQVVWKWRSSGVGGFLSHHISGVERLPNGNTLGCSAEMGHIVEVTPAGQLAWEYTCPISSGKASKFQENLGAGGNLFRAHRLSVNMPGLNTRVTMYADGSIQPNTYAWPGIGYTLTGAVPCRSIPCQYVGHP